MHSKLLTTVLLAGTALATLPLQASTGAAGTFGEPIIVAQGAPGQGRAAPADDENADPRRRRPQRPGADQDDQGQAGPGRRNPNAAQPAEPSGRPPAPGGRIQGGPPGQPQGAAPEPLRRPAPPAQEEPADAGRPRRDLRAPAPNEPAPPSPRGAAPRDSAPQGTPPRVPPTLDAPRRGPGTPPPSSLEPSGRPSAPLQRQPGASAPEAPRAPATTAPDAPAARPPAGGVPRTAPPRGTEGAPPRGTEAPPRGTEAPPQTLDAPLRPGQPGGERPRDRRDTPDQPPSRSGPGATPPVTAPPATAPAPAPRSQPAPAPDAAPQTQPRTPPPPAAPQPQTSPAAPAPQTPPAPRVQQPAPQAPAQAPAAGAPPVQTLAPGAGGPSQGGDRFAPGIATGGRDVRIDELRSLRRERTEDGGRRTIIEEPGNRIIVRENGREFIRHDETERFRQSYRGADVRVERRGGDQVTIIRQPNGIEILTVRDDDGFLVRRIRRDPRGVETVLIDNRFGDRPRRRTVIEEVVVLPPPRIAIPREKYVVEVERATQDDLYEAFAAPPVERIERRYSLDEIRQSSSLRERVRRVDVDTVTFDSGSWLLSESQIGALTGVAEAIRRTLDRNPNEIYLIEGHTDAVGPDVDNLTLSDRRAETVATILSERFGVPAENLTTQGYGEQYLKIASEGPERENRRVTVRRITPLLQQEANR